MFLSVNLAIHMMSNSRHITAREGTKFIAQGPCTPTSCNNLRFEDSLSKMSPPHTPTKPKKKGEYNTSRRARFFHAYFYKRKSTSLGAICRRKDINIPTSTAISWIREYELEGSPSIRRTIRSSSKLGKLSKRDVNLYEAILDPQYSSHDLKWPQMVQAEGLDIAPKTLQRHFKQISVRHYRRTRSTVLSPRNKVKWVDYDAKHSYKTIRTW
jgi:hypothetical protein